MTRRRLMIPLVLYSLLTACASTAHDGSAAPTLADALAVHRAWWSGVASSDAAAVRTHAAADLIATFSSGKQYDVVALVESMSANARKPSMQCRNESVRALHTSVAFATSECSETLGQYSNTYRFVSVLTPDSAGWKIAAAQSTLVATFTKRTTDVPPLGEFTGSYLTPRGLALDVTAADGYLQLREPSGTVLRLDPIGPSLFEADYVAPGGWITRYSFARDASGRVTSLNVLSPGAVNTFPRKS